MPVSDNEEVALWRKQFTDPSDYDLVGKMLEKFKFVSASEFRADMHAHIISSIPVAEKAGFFIERELQLVRPHWRYKKSQGYKVIHKSTEKVSVPMYPEIGSSRGPGRPKKWTAFGSPQSPVKSPTNLTQDIGSEGVVSTLVSKICKTDPARLVLHPHTKALRQMQVQHLVIVTDFIGSGNRTKEMLDSLWRVASVRSWKSSGYIKIMVICYSATDFGFAQVESHPCKPVIKKVCDCPSISTSFPPSERFALTSLCKRIPVGASSPLGYEDTGALIAFEHSCPNNVPAMFIETLSTKKSTWNALFHKRTTNELSTNELIRKRSDVHAEALEVLKCEKICDSGAYQSSSTTQRATIVLLAAIYRGHRFSSEIVTICGLPLVEILAAWRDAESRGFLTGSGRLTAQGLAQLKALLDVLKTHKVVANSTDINYYPLSLREPK